MNYDELVSELDKVGAFRYAHEKNAGCEMVQCSIFKILSVVNAVEQATLERAAKKFRENAELCADWMEHTKSMYLDGADVLDALKDSHE